jgi:hypothetical protein
MRFALIDNSTLTAVQRILGAIPIKNKHQIDADIVALESYLQAILFYDRIVYLDDYKKEYRSTRKAFFDNLLGFKPSEASYNALVGNAKGLTEGIVPCVEGGKITDSDFEPFFKLLKMNVVFSWDMSSSEYYLTVKMLENVGGLDIAKYSKLATMIYSELIEKNIVDVEISNKRALLYDSQGRPITSDYTVRDKEGKNKETGVSKQVNAFFAGLNWLAFRTIVYTLLANQLGIDLILHPIRNSFQVNLLHKLNLFNYPIYSQIISTMNGLVTETLNKVVNIAQPVIIHQQLPLFSAWFAQKTGDPQKFVETAYEIRDQELFIEARKQLIELEDILSKGDKAAYITKANQLILDIQQQMNKICSKFGVITTQGQSISPFIGVWNLSALATSLPQIPNMNLEIKALSI